MKTLARHYVEAYQSSSAIGAFLEGSAFVCAALFGAFIGAEEAAHAYSTLFVGLGAVTIRRYSDYCVSANLKAKDSDMRGTRMENASLQRRLASENANRTGLENFIRRKTLHLRETVSFIQAEDRKGTAASEIVRGVKENKERRGILNELLTEAWTRLDARFSGDEFFLTVWKVDHDRGVLVHERSKSRDGSQENYFADEFDFLNLSNPMVSPMVWLATSSTEQFYTIPSTHEYVRGRPFRFPSSEAEQEILSVLVYRVGDDIATTNAIVSAFVNRSGFFDPKENMEDFQIANTIVRQLSISVGYELAKLQHCHHLHRVVEQEARRRSTGSPRDEILDCAVHPGGESV